MTSRELLQRELEKRGMHQNAFAELLGISAPYLNGILKGKRSANDRLFEFAEKLGVDLFEKVSLQRRPIPVISWVHAGAFAEPTDSWPPGVSGIEEPVFTSVKTGPNAFGLRVEGDNMTPTLIPGDVAIVDPAIRCDNGIICVVWVNGEVSIKRLYDDEKEIRLVPDNPKEKLTVIPKDRPIDFRVIGKVVASERRH